MFIYRNKQVQPNSELSLLEQMTNANVTTEHTGNTVIENTVNSKKTK